jgi:hypothetical protein
MPASPFTTVWDALTPELRSSLLQHPARGLAPEDVDELVRAGARHAHAVWLDTRPGHPRQWATSWQFRSFIEHYRDSETLHRTGPYWRAPLVGRPVDRDRTTTSR